MTESESLKYTYQFHSIQFDQVKSNRVDPFNLNQSIETSSETLKRASAAKHGRRHASYGPHEDVHLLRKPGRCSVNQCVILVMVSSVYIYTHIYTKYILIFYFLFCIISIIHIL